MGRHISSQHGSEIGTTQTREEIGTFCGLRKGKSKYLQLDLDLWTKTCPVYPSLPIPQRCFIMLGFQLVCRLQSYLTSNSKYTVCVHRVTFLSDIRLCLSPPDDPHCLQNKVLFSSFVSNHLPFPSYGSVFATYNSLSLPGLPRCCSFRSTALPPISAYVLSKTQLRPCLL